MYLNQRRQCQYLMFLAFLAVANSLMCGSALAQSSTSPPSDAFSPAEPLNVLQQLSPRTPQQESARLSAARPALPDNSAPRIAPRASSGLLTQPPRKIDVPAVFRDGPPRSADEK
jgi:hypothetical protein